MPRSIKLLAFVAALAACGVDLKPAEGVIVAMEERGGYAVEDVEVQCGYFDCSIRPAERYGPRYLITYESNGRRATCSVSPGVYFHESTRVGSLFSCPPSHSAAGMQGAPGFDRAPGPFNSDGKGNFHGNDLRRTNSPPRRQHSASHRALRR